MSAQRDRLRDEVDLLSTHQSVLSVERKTTLRHPSAARVENGTVNVQLTEKTRLKEETEQKITDVQYELDVA